MIGKAIHMVKKVYTGSVGNGMSYEQEKALQAKGKELENSIYNLCKSEGMKVLKNVYLPASKNGALVEIDVLAISTKGVYIFEAKNYTKCQIHLTNDSVWSIKYNSGKSFPLYSPLKQNNSKVNVLTYNGIRGLKPVIVFPSKSTTSLVGIRRGYSSQIVNLDELANVLRNSKDILDKKEVKQIFQKVKTLRDTSLLVSWKHLRQVNKKKGRA